MIVQAFALLLAVQPVQAAPPQDPGAAGTGPRQWADGQVFWRSMPIPRVPPGEFGQVQARFTCTVGRRGAVRECRIERALPQDSGFARRVLRDLSRAELHMVPGMRSGDSVSFTLWACSDPTAACRQLPWPED